MQIADWEGFAQRKREATQARQAPRPRPCQLRRSRRSARRTSRPEITVRPEGRVDVVIGTQPSGQGHETSFAQVVADLLSRAGRDREDHPRRHRHREGRRRLAFRPLDAPCRDRVLQGRGRPDRARQARSPPRCSARRRTRSSSRTAGSRRATPTARSTFWSSPARPPSTRCPTISRTASRSSPTTRCTSRCFRTAARSARSRSIPTPATSRSPAMPRSTTSAAASIR